MGAHDLQAVVILAALTLIAVLVPPINATPLRIFFALPFLFFLPGYVFVAALFPGKEGLDWIERIVFSIGLSIAIVSLAGFALNFTRFGITLAPVISVLYVFIIACSSLSYVRRRRVPEEERFTVELKGWAKALRDLF